MSDEMMIWWKTKIRFNASISLVHCYRTLCSKYVFVGVYVYIINK